MGKIKKLVIAGLIILELLQVLALPMTLPEAVRLQKDVLSAPYSIWDYKEDEFDCSNMALLLADWLELRGWDMDIIVGDGPNATAGHVWIEEKETGKYIETTKKTVFLPKSIYFFYCNLGYNTDWFPLRNRYDSSTEVFFSAGAGLEPEWDYYQYIDYPTLHRLAKG